MLSRRMKTNFPVNYDKRHNLNDFYVREVYENTYAKETNENGIINLATAFSYLSDDLLSEKLQEVMKCDLGKPWHYLPPVIHTDFKCTLAAYYTKVYKAHKPILPENLVVINGTTIALDYLAHCTADPGEIFLIPSPFYTYLHRNVNQRAQVDVIPIDTVEKAEKDSPDENEVRLRLTAEKVEKSIQTALIEGKVVRGIILVNPCNPSGEVYDSELMRKILNICKKYSIHVIIDEIHSRLVFAEGFQYESVLSFPNLPDPDRTHVLWSFSKDFCMSGARTAVLCSFSKPITEAMKSMACFFEPSVAQQSICNQIIQDEEWQNVTFFPTLKDRLRRASGFLIERLESLGILVQRPLAGFVIMAYFGKFFSEPTFEEEGRFTKNLIKHGVYIQPGYTMYCSMPGWYRIVFSFPDDILNKGLDRIEAALREFQGGSGSLS